MQYRIIPDIIQEQTVYQLSEDCSIIDASRKMFDFNVGAISVLGENGELLGIITERDMTRRVLAKGLNPLETKVGDIMTKNPDTLAPEDSARDALELMQTRCYRHLPVVKEDRVVGMVSIRDLYAAVKMALEEDIRETEAFVFGDRYGA